MFTVSYLLEHRERLSYEEKINAKLQGPPQVIFRFEGPRQCNFNDQYAKHKWLCGCPDRKAFFCFPCLLLCGRATNSWTKYGVKDLGNLSNFSKKHEKSFDHVSACTAFALLGERNFPMDKTVQRDQHNKEVRANREMLRHHIDMLMYLVRQGIPLRSYDEPSSSETNSNFIEGMQLLGSYSGNFLLHNSLNIDGERIGLSLEIQNDLLDSLFTILKEEIKHRVKAAEFVSISVHETTELNNSTQLGISIRLVHEGVVHEHLIDLVDHDPSTNRSPTDLTSLIVTSLGDNAGVDTTVKVVGQAYDGTKKMIGGIDSVSTIFQLLWPSAHLVHCHAHKWEHLLRQACGDLQEIVLFFGAIDSLTSFFHSSLKRSSLLSSILPNDSIDKWFNHREAICVIDKHYFNILNLLLSLPKDGNFDCLTRAEAATHVHQLQIPVNIFLLKLFGVALARFEDIELNLRSSKIDPVLIANKIDEYQQYFIQIRNNDAFFQRLWKATDVVDDKGPPRKREAIEKTESNEDFSEETHFRDLLLQVSHCLLQQIAERFHQIKRFAWIKTLQSDNLIYLPKNPIELQSHVFQFASLYPSFVIDEKRLKVQLQSFVSDQLVRELLTERKLRDCGDLLNIFIDYNLQDALPDVCTMILIGTTIPLLNIQGNGEFSVLKRLKNYCHNTTKHGRTKQLVLMGVEKDVLSYLSEKSDFYDRVIDVFANMKKRHMNLFYQTH